MRETRDFIRHRDMCLQSQHSGSRGTYQEFKEVLGLESMRPLSQKKVNKMKQENVVLGLTEV